MVDRAPVGPGAVRAGIVALVAKEFLGVGVWAARPADFVIDLTIGSILDWRSATIS
jgi:hypothetical protein